MRKRYVEQGYAEGKTGATRTSASSEHDHGGILSNATESSVRSFIEASLLSAHASARPRNA
jgi:hypothetical protein